MTDTEYCCKEFEYNVNTFRLQKFYDGWYRMCGDCDRHNGEPEKYCSNCGTKITNV